MCKQINKPSSFPVRAISQLGRTQRGVVMIIALIVLIAMSLAGVALVRSVDTTNLVAGNIGFKQGALQESNNAMETAIGLFALTKPLGVTIDTPELLWPNKPDQNYSAQLLPVNNQGIPLALVNAKNDITAFDTNPAFLIKATTDPFTKNVSRFVIDRLCFLADVAADDSHCRMAEISADGNTDGEGTHPRPIPLYRITTRVDGPNNTVSYTQSIISSSTNSGQ
jgi:type IV pilus assembly protein PilX